MSVQSTGPLSGRTHAPEQFLLAESHRVVDVDAVFAVLHGELAAYRVSGFVDPADCRRISDNFAASPMRTPRYGQGEDGVEGYFVGASHIEKTTESYLDEVERFAHAVTMLWEGTRDALGDFLAVLRGHQPPVPIRPAAHGGRAAGSAKAVCWTGTGEFLLLPHDDLAQLSDPLQAGFEIQTVRRVMAINFYPYVPAGTGQLKLWNLEPDDESRRRLGLAHSGYPYPPELLREVPSLDVTTGTGDLCVINGNLVHAVLGGRAAPDAGRRLLLACFSGLNADNEMIWWT
ncbi:hypothetical protein TPA0907_56910 [Micromonospora humidisoli]|uniref:Phytanoyl-CoA dioxygenase (PhyH) n=1 Tax=Micromonospora humidisoli TaxID=2807622 RepID=A0ABS2JKT3_9ACTN|nr:MULTISPECIES: hypothetical protein [Micromonospora]MBM7086665.1 hypothetical protein [Micromonospora humidisoli]GHJ11324.1 hypothetical protein TPA0907_56910 [Micromonospora sp. AKA109]